MGRFRTTITVLGLLGAAALGFASEGPQVGPTAPTTAAATSPATAPVAAAVAKEIEALVKDLGGDTWKRRQTAQDKLVTFGADAVPFLQKTADQTDDDEVRSRAGAALAAIEQNARTGPSFVTIKVKDARPEDVFAEIGRQARYEFPTYPRNLWKQRTNFPAITMDLERVNFWTAFKEACQKTGVNPQQSGNDRRLSLYAGRTSSWNGPSVVSGPFLIVANRVSRSNGVDLANPANVQSDFSVNLSVFTEPKIRVIQASQYAKLDEVVDDRGNSLVPAESRTFESMHSGGQQWMWNLIAKLKYPAENPGKTITRLKGSVRFMVQTRSESLDVPDILTAKNLTKTVAGRRFLIKEVKKTGDQYEVAMTIYRDGMNPGDWNALQYPGYAVKLYDKDGRALSSHGWGGGGGTSEMNYTWTFGRHNFGGDADAKPGEPHRLVWEIPLETRESVLPFEFKDLPLP